MSQNSYSAKFDIKKEAELRTKLESCGFKFKPLNYAFWSAQGSDVTVSLYKSGKILVQGKGCSAFTTEFLNASPQLSLGVQASKPKDSGLEHDFDCWIGTDESGKGDYFGPLVVAGVIVDRENIQTLIDLGIKDSKKLTDKYIEKIAWQVKNCTKFSIVTMTPSKYNELYASFKNLNKLLAWGHARVIENLLEKQACKNAISDKFGDESLIKNALMKKGQSINLVQRVRAESDIAVAAASVLARHEYVTRMNKMSQDFGLEFPKGASTKVNEQANLFIKKYDFKSLEKVAKLHFKTTNFLSGQSF